MLISLVDEKVNLPTMPIILRLEKACHHILGKQTTNFSVKLTLDIGRGLSRSCSPQELEPLPSYFFFIWAIFPGEHWVIFPWQIFLG